MVKYSEDEEELNVAHYVTTGGQSPKLVIGGSSGALSVFDINQRRIVYAQKDMASKNELTKIFTLAKSEKLLVLNADQQMTIYTLESSKKGSQLVAEYMSCLYLDEIIDARVINDTTGEEDETKKPSKALICSNNELLKVVDL